MFVLQWLRSLWGHSSPPFLSLYVSPLFHSDTLYQCGVNLLYVVQLMGYSVHKANLYAGACNMVLAAITWLWSLHSDITSERMWHLLILVLLSFPCFAVYLWVGSHHGQQTVSPTSMYGLIYLGQLAMAGQPIVASYRSITLYGAAEQAVGLASTAAGLTIAGIIGPQVSS